MQKKHYRIFGMIICCILPFVLGSCATVPQGARESAQYSSAFTKQIKNEVEEFSNFRTKLEKARRMNINDLEINAIETGQYVETYLAIWNTNYLQKPKEKDIRVLLFESIRAATQKAYDQHIELDKLKEEHSKVVSDTNSAIKLDSNKLEIVAKGLAELSEQPDLETQAQFLIEFASDVGSTIEELKEKAQTETEKGLEESEEKNSDLKKAAEVDKDLK